MSEEPLIEVKLNIQDILTEKLKNAQKEARDLKATLDKLEDVQIGSKVSSSSIDNIRPFIQPKPVNPMPSESSGSSSLGGGALSLLGKFNIQGMVTGFVGGIAQSITNSIIDGFKSAASIVTDMIKGAVKEGFEYNVKKEQIQGSLNTLLGEDEGAAAFTRMQEMAKKTPYDLPQLNEIITGQLAKGQTVDQSFEMAKAIGNIKGALPTANIGGTNLQLGQIMSNPKITGTDLKQLQTALGYSVDKIIGAGLGKTVTQKDVLKLDSKEFGNLFMKGVEKLFGGSMDRAGDTMGQKMATLQETIASSFGGIIEPLFQRAKPVIDWITDEIENLEKELKPVIEDTIKQATPAVKAFFDKLKDEMPGLTKSFEDLIPVFGAWITLTAEIMTESLPLLRIIAPAIKTLRRTGENAVGVIKERPWQEYLLNGIPGYGAYSSVRDLKKIRDRTGNDLDGDSQRATDKIREEGKREATDARARNYYNNWVVNISSNDFGEESMQRIFEELNAKGAGS